jgi:pyruvate,water dikinase
MSEFKKLKAQYVAVRSSATAEDSKTASWAGELETYLNTTEKDLLNKVKKCWSSLFTPRAIFYRHEKKLLKSKVSVAVVVQKMIQSEVSGICFTVHPVTKDKNQMILEAGLGLGEAIVSGQITPDSYVLDKRDWSIMDINIAEQTMMIAKKGKITAQIKLPKAKGGKQKLAGKQIVELAKLCGTIEKHYGFPCDIEWAMEKGKFYITQSRPITTL